MSNVRGRSPVEETVARKPGEQIWLADSAEHGGLPRKEVSGERNAKRQ